MANIKNLEKKIDLSVYGIKEAGEIHYNSSYEELYEHEMDENLDGFAKGFLTENDAVAVDTGIFTGRSPKDKYIVKGEDSKDNIWWAGPRRKGSDNKPISQEVWNDLLETSRNQFEGKKLYIMDAFCGANEDTQMKIRVITEVAWMAHFVKNMFIRPTDEELENFEPDFVMLNACKTVNENWEEHQLNSDVYAAFNIEERMAVVGGSWYGGEIKKGIFSIMNYFLPLKGIAAMHCSANMGKDGDTALFFGLSGTGKTTLSADPKRFLIGDDEHGWDEEGVFNFEGGCYAKCINLKAEKEPDIYNAIRRDALLENVVFDENGKIDFDSNAKTENTRVSYPIYHIDNIVKPISKGGHPKHIIFLTADAFGVLPPVAKLDKNQTMYYFLSGYTAKLAGTERGVKEPMPTFSSAFGAAFLLLHPTVYATELAKKMEEHGSTAYLVNTGWIGGAYGAGSRIDLPITRKIIDSILDGSLDKADYHELPIFGLSIPKHIDGIEDSVLNPRGLWKYKTSWDQQARTLANKFIKNFENFTDLEEGKKLIASGPRTERMEEIADLFNSKFDIYKETKDEEIDFLKKQVDELRNLLETSGNYSSFGKEYKENKLTRYVAVDVYVENETEIILKKVIESVGILSSKMNFELDNRIEQGDNEFHKKFMIKSNRELKEEDLSKLMIEIHRVLKARVKRGELFEVHHEIAFAVANLFKIIEHIPELIIKIGSVILVKSQKSEYGNIERAKKLTNAELMYLEEHAHLLNQPSIILWELKGFLKDNFIDEGLGN